MPDEPSTEAEVQASNATPKKKGKKKLLLLVVTLFVLLGGAGGGLYFWRAKAHAPDKTGGKDPDAGHDSEDGKVKKVIELQPFIVNLADKDDARYLRVSISLGVGAGEHGEEKADPLFSTKVRNAILAVVTTKTSDEVLTVEGKAALRKEMLEAARSAVKIPEIHTIYITDFIVQMWACLPNQMNPTTEDIKAANEAILESWRSHMDLKVPLAIELGRTKLTAAAILELEPQAIVQLLRSTGEGVDVLAGELLLARGEIIMIEDRTGIRINEIISREL